jgi:hypothetical protein
MPLRDPCCKAFNRWDTRPGVTFSKSRLCFGLFQQKNESDTSISRSQRRSHAIPSLCRRTLWRDLCGGIYVAGSMVHVQGRRRVPLRSCTWVTLRGYARQFGMRRVHMRMSRVRSELEPHNVSPVEGAMSHPGSAPANRADGGQQRGTAHRGTAARSAKGGIRGASRMSSSAQRSTRAPVPQPRGRAVPHP